MTDAVPLFHREALADAYRIAASCSTDPSTQNAAVIYDNFGQVLAEGWNGFPRGFAESPNRWERPQKYQYVEHAERNAIYCAARLGVSTRHATMVAPWAACYDCARAIIQAGIETLIRHADCTEFGLAHGIKWQDLSGPDDMLREAGILIVDYHGKVGAPEMLHSGKKWMP